jgi:hypothetical protein
MDPETKTELTARVEALKELGPEHEAELVAGFIERLDQEIDRRIDERLAKLPKPKAARRKSFEDEIALFIPIFVIGGIFAGTLGIAAAAAALAFVLILKSFR